MSKSKLTEILQTIMVGNSDELFELGWINAWDDKKKCPYGGDKTGNIMIYDVVDSCYNYEIENILDFNDYIINNKYLSIINGVYESCRSAKDISRHCILYTYTTQYEPKFTKKFYDYLNEAIQDEAREIHKIPRIQFNEIWIHLKSLMDINGVSPIDSLSKLDLNKLVRFSALDKKLSMDELEELSKIEFNYSYLVRSKFNMLLNLRKLYPNVSFSDMISIMYEVYEDEEV